LTRKMFCPDIAEAMGYVLGKDIQRV